MGVPGRIEAEALSQRIETLKIDYNSLQIEFSEKCDKLKATTSALEEIQQKADGSWRLDEGEPSPCMACLCARSIAKAALDKEE